MAQSVLDLPGDENGLAVEDTFSVADVEGDPHAVLAQLRTRLLDLTLVNRLINFKHGARTVRVIDELPDQLFTRLRSGDELEFLPVPAPPSGHPAATRTGSEKQAREKAVQEYAREMGLRTEFELPSPKAGAASKRHTDAAIQTLLFPADLERCLGKIASDARSAIEEKGSNILYLVFGFLEWFEREDAAKAIRSPLLMLPLTLRKGEPDRKTGAYRFYISYSGEDVLPNISLQEKLRRDFQITIPDFEEDEAPESYMARIAKNVPLPPSWKVRREISLGLLLFSKLLMYRDLDPANWPEGQSPAQHPRLNELFGAGSPSGQSDYANEYDFEAPSSDGTPALMPPIVMDADSSQHSAIVDAMAGRSFVIEGPPGTGKSQTIANLIAAALGNGKSVLFVADKLTALEVVGRRLDDVGLGVFCLELHSDKTQKSRLMEDVGERLSTRGKFRDPAALNERIGVLQSARNSLNAYAALVNQPFGGVGWTIHEILWGAQRRRTALGQDAERWAAITLPDAAGWRLAQLEELQRAATSFGKALATLRSRGPAESHPFRGVALTRLTPDAEENVLRTLTKLHELCGSAGSLFQWADTELEGSVPRDSGGLQSWIAALSTLAAEAQGCLLDLLPRMANRADRRLLSQWSDELEAYLGLDKQLSAAAPDARARDALLGLSADPFSFFRPETRLDALRQTPEHLRGSAAAFARADALMNKVGNLLEDDAYPRSLNALDLAVSVIELASSAPFGALAFRPRTHEAVEAVLHAAIPRAAALKSERAELGLTFDLANLPSVDVLEQCAATCATAGFFSFLSGQYRAAKRQFIVLSLGSSPGTEKDVMAAAFKRLAAHERQVASFNGSEELKAVLGPCFTGLDTNFDAIEECLRWQAQVTALQRRHRGLTRRIEILATASPNHLREVAVLQDEAKQIRLVHILPVLERSLAASHLVLDRNAPFSSLMGPLTESVNRARPFLQAADLLNHGHAVTVADLSELVGSAQALVEMERSLKAAAPPRAILQAHYKGLDTSVDATRSTLALAEALFDGHAPDALRRYFLAKLSPFGAEVLVVHLRRTEEALSAVLQAELAFLSGAEVVTAEWYGANGPRPFDEIAARTARAVTDRVALAPWVAYLRARAALSKVGLDHIRFVAETNTSFDLATVPLAAEFVFYRSLARAAFETFPALSEHDGLEHSAIRERFRKYDQESIRLERERLACRIDARPVPLGISSSLVRNRTELALLEHEITKQKRHLPIRQLVNRAGGALLALKPCFMMSPRSVAQYLEGGRHAFDLVVMDEASQLRPEDAIGAIARGKQIVIVGDSKQLPPTSFFSSGEESNDEDTEELITENKESILDLARTSYRPSRQLRWHYRSKHGSLIAFSNKRYYGDSLVVFPGPQDRTDDLGVSLVHVADASYADGQNQREAERVTDAVIEHLKTRPNETFGVVALNIRQKTLIESMVHDRLKDAPELRERFDRVGENDGAFIKNLESVQGDERDVIYISVTYGPSTPGARVARRFGPINGANGWRRLNVLFTRAKLRVIVFASFTPEQLDAGGELPPGGVKDLRDYLAFARTGRYQHSETSDRAPDSDFELEVADALRNLGYGVTPQVGVAGYFIDMGVRSKQRAGQFVLGVECDGATYHSSFSARDRDRLRQQVLEGLGWKIHRIWSTDWFRDPRTQTERLRAAIQAAE